MVQEGNGARPRPPKLRHITTTSYLVLEYVRGAWGHATQGGRRFLLNGVVYAARTSARYPIVTIAVTILISVLLFVAGYMTNFDIRLNNEELFTPVNSKLVDLSAYMDKWAGRVASSPKPHLDDNPVSIVNFSRMDPDSTVNLATTEMDPRNSTTIYPVSRNNVSDGHDIPGRDLSLRDTSSHDVIAHNLSLNAAIDNISDYNVTEFNTSVYNGSSYHNLSRHNVYTYGDDDEAEFNANNTSKGNLPTYTMGLNQTGDAAITTLSPNSEKNQSAVDDSPSQQNQRSGHGEGTPFSILVHANGKNVFTIEGMEKLFDVIDYMRKVPGYEKQCLGGQNSFTNYYGQRTCEIRAATRLWHNNRTLFREQIHTNEDLHNAANVKFYPDGDIIDLSFILAHPKFDEKGRPVACEAYFAWVYIKNGGGATSCSPLGCELLDRFKVLAAEWDKDGQPYVLDFFAPYSFVDEALHAIIADLPLLPTAFLMMCLFTCLVFYKCHRVHSRTLLGVGAVVTVCLSVMTGYGLMFLCGVPLTMMTNILVFIVLGIGLDDTFIITGSYFRTCHNEDPVHRIESTMETVGSSIFLTSITTAVAFIVGCSSTIVPIRWLCLYAASTVIIDFLYQITFFIALLVLDERRIQQQRMDCCLCIHISKRDERNDTYTGHAANEHIADRFMKWFASCLMRCKIKYAVLCIFFSFAVVCIWSTTRLKQEFQFKDLMPKGSYGVSYLTAMQRYTDRAIGPWIVFRDVDQSDELVQDQMLEYIDDLVANVDAFGEEPPLCWLKEFRKYLLTANERFKQKPFTEQLDELLSDPAIGDAFSDDIIRRQDGNITASRCQIFVTDLNMDSVQAQIDFLQQQDKVTIDQPVNQGGKRWAFFTYDPLYNIFAFFEAAARQLTVTIVSSVVAVFVIAFVLIPHWTASLIITPILSMLFIEMMGVLQLFGYAINVVTYVTMVVSIGLLVDFLMHILLSFYESEFASREEKVKDALGTMGASILVGGLSTFLGVVPLLFSTSEIFSTVSMTFLAMVVLGVSHGLVLLPVILSYIGTEQTVKHRERLVTSSTASTQ